MSILDARTDEMLGAARNAPFITPPKPEAKFNAWQFVTAIPRGSVEGLAQVGATGADLAQAINDPRHKGGAVPLERFSSAEGDAMREYGTMLRPDAKTAHAAEQVLYQASRVLTKVVGGAMVAGIPGVLAAAAEEGFTQSDELRLQGVDPSTRIKAGAVAAAGTSLAVLPVAGQTLGSTAALYAVGGPLGFMAQQAATREILQAANYDKIAMQYDPFDPVGLAVSSLIPAPFAAYGLRGNKARAAADAKAAADAAEAARIAAIADGPEPVKTPVAQAVAAAYPPEAVDAARVRYAVEEQQRASLAEPADPVAVRADEAAAAKAEEQIAKGERVEVREVAPEVLDPAKVAQADAILKLADEWGVDPWQVPEQQPARAALSPIDAEALRGMGSAAYWAEVGGKMIRGALQPNSGMDAPVVARTKWIPAEEWFARMRSSLGSDGLSKQADIQAAIEKAIAGEKLKAKEQRTVDWIRAELDDMKRRLRENEFLPDEYDRLTQDAFSEGLAAPDAGDLALVARAAEIDSNAVEAAAVKYENDDAAFMAEIKRIANDGQQTQAAAKSGSGPGEGGPGARQAQDPGEAASPGEKVAAESAQARIDAVRAQFPDLLVQLDGMDKPMKLADFLAMAKAEADEMLADAPLYEVAAQCAITNGQ
jgi:hypothetical protein